MSPLVFVVGKSTVNIKEQSKREISNEHCEGNSLQEVEVESISESKLPEFIYIAIQRKLFSVDREIAA